MSVLNEEEIRKLIIDWLTAWKNDAAKAGSKMEFVYSKALKSFREYPDPVRSGLDCKKIKFFGDKTCKRIDDSLRYYCQKSGISTSELNSTEECSKDNDNRSQDLSSEVSLKDLSEKAQDNISNKKSNKSNVIVKRSRNYMPKYRSLHYAILITLFKLDTTNDIYSLTKNELLLRAQPYCDESLTNQKSSSWSALNVLIKHELLEVEKTRHCRYFLTQKGRELASRLVRFESAKEHKQPKIGHMLINEPECDMIHSEDNECDVDPDIQEIFQKERFALCPGNYDIYLLIDSREQYSGGSNELKKTAILSEFLNRDIKCRMIMLPLGDFAWMAKEKNSKQGFLKELILDYVIERKRYDDLASSIRSGRWSEQKYRLSHSGIRRPMYLIEDFGPHRTNEHFYSAMVQAIADAQVIDKFIVKQTKNYQETIEFLVTMTRCLESQYSNKTLFSCTKEEIVRKLVPTNYLMSFNEFSLNAEKITNFTQSEMFVKHLLKFKGISVIKAKSIVEHYQTLKKLLDAYKDCETVNEREQLLSEITFGSFNKKIGSKISKKIFKHYSTYLDPLDID